VDDAGLFLGAVNLHDASRALRASPAPASVHVRDVMVTRFEVTVPEEPLDQALERFFRQDAERLPVLDSREGRHLVGTISKRDILGVYSLERLQRDASPLPAGGPEGVIGEVAVPPGLVGATVQHADFQGRYGLSIVMVRPSGTGWVLPSATIRLGPEDRLIVFGPRERIDALAPSPAP
jgi:hypothetical protein